MTINEFEDQIEAKVTDSRRLLLEALQIESYLFSPKTPPPPPPKKKVDNSFPNRKGPFNDWYATIGEVLLEYQYKFNFVDFVHQERIR